MKRRISRALVLSALALSGALVLAACGGDDNMDGMDHGNGGTTSSAPAAPGGSTAPGAFNDTDVMFAQMMIPHHEQAVEMAKVVLAKTANADIKKLATAIEAAQAPEIAQMKGWLSAWGKPTAMPSGGSMPGMDHGSADGMMSDADMQKFKAAAGTELDRQFLEMMIVHHNGAIKMAEDELAKGTNPDARKLAEAIKSSQSAEVQEMQRLLAGTGAKPGATPAPTATSSGSMPGMGH
ncbi:DUF305 domain-containing protein [Yinghuangia soli]|uniref:DUF305 domain-containing protein n=1 Tax=Yinghuangia soli TaxID=2908204 RepID=A0AA41PXP8_9ACTN|nr:DUF305 domain-containing protein [Yinghuangia soli]MCF2527798.1 DUF305 domain-containing protein [Yinghuangia soli]